MFLANLDLFTKHVNPIETLRSMNTFDVARTSARNPCYLPRRIIAIAHGGQMVPGPGKDQWQVGPGHWQHFVVHLRYPWVPSIIEGRAGAAKVDFPVPKEGGKRRAGGGGRLQALLENLYTEREGVVYTAEGRLDLIRWWFFNESSCARHLGDRAWFTASILRRAAAVGRRTMEERNAVA